MCNYVFERLYMYVCTRMCVSLNGFSKTLFTIMMCVCFGKLYVCMCVMARHRTSSPLPELQVHVVKETGVKPLIDIIEKDLFTILRMTLGVPSSPSNS